MPLTEPHVREITRTFLEEWGQHLLQNVVVFMPDHPAVVPRDDTTFLTVALYGQHLHDASAVEMQLAVVHIARLLFRMPGYATVQVPWWFKTDHAYGRLWNDAYVCAHEGALVSLTQAVELVQKGRPKFKIQNLMGFIDRGTLETWNNPNPPPTRKQARLVRIDQLQRIS